MKIYTIIGGVNGVGKSSLSGVLSAEKSDLGIIIDTDKITTEEGGDKVGGGKTAIKRISDCLHNGVTFTQESTLSGVRTLKTIRKAHDLGYFIRLYYIGLNSADESIKRIRNRVEKGGHNISSEDVQRRYSKRFEDLAKVLYDCDEVRFFDNENGFVEKAEFKDGKLIRKSEKWPTWLEDLQKYLEVLYVYAHRLQDF